MMAGKAPALASTPPHLQFIGDERADKVRRQYGRPLKAVVITEAGVLAPGEHGALALAAGSAPDLP
jgi:hypothetical protein